MSDLNNGNPTINQKPIESKTQGTRLVVKGYGISKTVEGIDDLKTCIPILYHPELKEHDIGLIQGGVQVGAVENGLAVTFDAMYGYYLRKDNRTYIPAGVKSEENRYERDVFSFGAHVYETSLAYIKEYTAQVVNKMISQPDQSEKILTIIVSEVAALKDRIMIALTDQFSRSYRLRDDRGYFRWIGLAQETDGRSKFPSTVMVIPNIIEGSKQVFLRGNSVPYQPGTSAPILPMDTNLFQGFFCGVMHKVENQVQYTPACAIRATLFHSVYGGNYGLTKLLSAAARAGIFPRLGSRDQDGVFLWQKLAAIAMSVKFYQTYYNASLPTNIGEVRYIFSGSGLTKVLEQMINMYIEASMLSIQTVPSNAKQGVFWMPATNDADAAFHFGFVSNPQKETDYMRLNITDLRSKLYLHYDSVPAIVGSDGYIEVTDEMQTSDKWRPLLIRPIHTIRERIHHLGAGFETRTLEITDVMNEESWAPSEMIESMIIGWNPMFAPKSIIMRKAQTPSSFRDFKAFELLTADQGTERAYIKSPWMEKSVKEE